MQLVDRADLPELRMDAAAAVQRRRSARLAHRYRSGGDCGGARSVGRVRSKAAASGAARHSADGAGRGRGTQCAVSLSCDQRGLRPEIICMSMIQNDRANSPAAMSRAVADNPPNSRLRISTSSAMLAICADMGAGLRG